MKLIDICVSLEPSQELKKEGYPQESLFYWTNYAVIDHELVKIKPSVIFLHGIKNIAKSRANGEEPSDYFVYSAPTASELGEALKKGVIKEKWHVARESREQIYQLLKRLDRSWRNDSELEDRAKLWLYLKKEGLLDD